MVATKAVGVIPCAHCTQRTTEVTCALCGRQICAECAGDRNSCSEPVTRELRLGIGNRLVDVSRDGRYGVVQHKLTRSRRLLDLHQLAYYRHGPLPRGRLLGGPRFVRLYNSWPEQPDVATTRVAVARPHGEVVEQIVAELSAPLQHWRVVSSGADFLCAVHTNQQVRVLDLARGTHSLHAPMAYKVVQVCDFDPTTRLLVSASYGVARLERVDAGEATALATLSLVNGDAEWCGVAGDRAFTIVREAARFGRAGRVEVWSARPPYQRMGTLSFAGQWGEPDGYDCSRDGRLLAVATHDHWHVIVYDQATGDTVSLEGHTDPVNLVRFVAGDRLLITADRDNRVILWPRTAEGFASRRVELELADRELELPQRLA